MHLCDELTREHQGRVQQQTSRSGQAQELLDSALEGCITGGGGWSFFGGRSRRIVRVFVDHLAAFARQCLAEDTSVAVLQFFATLRGKLADQVRDIGFCRQRLRAMQQTLELQHDSADGDVENMADSMTFTRSSPASFNAPTNWGPGPANQLSTTPLLSTESYWETIRESTTNRVVLPDGEMDLQQAARHFMAILTAEHWSQLDQAIGDQAVLAPSGGLLTLCLDNQNLERHFLLPLLNQAITCLSDHLPITDVAQAEFSTGDGLLDRIVGYHAAALPLLVVREKEALPPPHTKVGLGSGLHRTSLGGGRSRSEMPPERRVAGGKKAGGQQSFLLIPASEAGKKFGDQARGIAARTAPGERPRPGRPDVLPRTNRAGHRGHRAYSAPVPRRLPRNEHGAALLAARSIRHPGLDAARPVKTEEGFTTESQSPPER